VLRDAGSIPAASNSTEVDIERQVATGSDLPSDPDFLSASNEDIQSQSKSNFGQTHGQTALMDGDLVFLAVCWPRLPPAMRAAIVAMVKAAAKPGGEP